MLVEIIGHQHLTKIICVLGGRTLVFSPGPLGILSRAPSSSPPNTMHLVEHAVGPRVGQSMSYCITRGTQTSRQTIHSIPKRWGKARTTFQLTTIKRFSQHSINGTNVIWLWQLQILVPRLVSVPHKLPKTIGHRHSKQLELYFCPLLSETCSSRSQWCPFRNSDIPTSQPALKQSYTEKTNGQNNNDKTKKPSHSISVNYCNIFTYFRVYE